MEQIETPEQTIPIETSDKRKKIFIISYAIGGILVILLALASVLFIHTPGSVKSVAQTSSELVVQTAQPIQRTNMLNGEKLTEEEYTTLSKNRPLAVMIPNDPSARPQFGLNKADVVYEALTEGPITRFMAIFWSHQEDFKIMPVRSIRVYFLQWLLEYNDIIVMHTGYAETANPLTNALAILKDYAVKTLIWDFPVVYDGPCQNTRPVWNCAKTTSQTLWNVANTKHQWTGNTWAGLTQDMQWKFKDSALSTTLPSATHITIPFLYANDYSQTYWEYDSIKNIYLKEDYQRKPFVDATDNSTLYTKTLVIEQVPFSQTHDEKDRSIQNVLGKGNAYVFEDGKVIQGTWKKDDIKSRTRFYDTSGNEIAFNRGRIWITVVPNTQTITFTK